MGEKELSYSDIAKSPIPILDDFAGWLDGQYASNTTQTVVFFAKKILKAYSVKISIEEFREKVTLPKKRPFDDKKDRCRAD
ncbi:MAG: hypothetical protein EX285_03160 [Thaumarchaeota archaeon]|nr:hypothetical protein [Nitrososphaerota archaeon]